MSYLSINNISATYNNLDVLSNINIEIQEGEIVALIGPSGCGKTTLFNIIGGILLPTNGDVVLKGRSIVGTRGLCAYLFQEDRLLPWRTVLKNMLLVDEIRNNYTVKIEDAILHLKNMGLDGFEKYYPHQLSGGMKKRASLARTFYLGGNVLLLDEPLASLDYGLRLDLEQQIYSHIIKDHKTALIITHSYDTAVALADRIILFDSSPATVKTEIVAGYARKYDDPLLARKSNEFHSLYKKLIELRDTNKIELLQQ